jgi:hypothetical protein
MTPHRIVVVVLMYVLAQLVPGGGGGMEVAAQPADCPMQCATLIGQAAIPGCIVIHHIEPPPFTAGGVMVVDIVTGPIAGLTAHLVIDPSHTIADSGFACGGQEGNIPLESAEYGACLSLFHQEVAAANCERVQ